MKQILIFHNTKQSLQCINHFLFFWGISGHRRQHAAHLAGLETLPVIVRNMDDDAAVLLMVDSNLQRENILPSERAFAYKMKLEALKNQGARSDLTSAQIGPKLTAAEKVAEEANDTKSQAKRFIRLTCLIPELLDMVDEKKIAFNPAVELSYLDESQQRDFLEAMNDTQNAPSLSQAQRLKKLAQEGHFSYDVAFAVMGEEKKDELDKVVIKNDTLRKYFPRSYTPKQMEDTIIKLLDQTLICGILLFLRITSAQRPITIKSSFSASSRSISDSLKNAASPAGSPWLRLNLLAFSGFTISWLKSILVLLNLASFSASFLNTISLNISAS